MEEIYMTGKMNENKIIKEKALIVGVNLNKDPHFEESIKELRYLAEACDLELVGEITQNLQRIHPRHYLGMGKLEEINQFIDREEVEVVVFEDELSPSQMRNLSLHLGIEILDRTRLILEIFNRRAKTREAKLQVEVANLKYILPRLRSGGQNFDRQRGGGVNNRGGGETKLELNRRKIETNIVEIEKELKQISSNREVSRKRRQQSGVPLVALVGYTNAGKSTIMNAMVRKYKDEEKKLVFEKDMVFATLSTSIRDIKFNNGKRILLSDTVGFINKLPHHLVRAFYSTLEEVLEADLILHVVDCSNPNFEKHIEVTNSVLKSIGGDEIDQIMVYNKIDQASESILEENQGVIHLSAKKDIGFEELEKKIEDQVLDAFQTCQFMIPHKDSYLISELKLKGNILTMDYVDNGILITVDLPEVEILRYTKLLNA